MTNEKLVLYCLQTTLARHLHHLGNRTPKQHEIRFIMDAKRLIAKLKGQK